MIDEKMEMQLAWEIKI